MLKLASAARILVRPGPAIQFGVDARRAGVVTDLDPARIADVVCALNAATTPLRHSELLMRLEQAGLTSVAARSLLVDLTAYRILHSVPVEQPAVAVLGRSVLAGMISELLQDSSCEVRRPLRGESDKKFLRAVVDGMPLVVTDRIANGRRFAPLLRSAEHSAYVPASIIDGQGHIGPLMISDRGPCPMCVDLFRAEADPHWHHVSAQLPGGPTQSDSTVLTLTAASVAGVIKQYVGLATAAPGVDKRELHPGWRMRIDPYSRMHEDVVSPHRLCPLCFAAQHRK